MAQPVLELRASALIAPSQGREKALEAFGRVCRIRARRVYRAVGAEDCFRRRRIISKDVLGRRLLTLPTASSSIPTCRGYI